MENRLLPIGTVVRLRESTASVMIMGYLPMGPARPGYVWDYSGVKFPMGFVRNEEVYCFDQDQIEMIEALGYQDQEEFGFIRAMELSAEKIKADALAAEDARLMQEEAEDDGDGGDDANGGKDER
ncbi:MAG: DUF4176 domain-containing protein [Lachnospiraceae bacterium]|nr:DUF4176 domain-containing protein [Lachnospiraceae bacterium]